MLIGCIVHCPNIVFDNGYFNLFGYTYLPLWIFVFIVYQGPMNWSENMDFKYYYNWETYPDIIL